MTVDLHDEVLEVKEAAAFIRMSEEWLERSDVPRAKLGRRVLFLRSELLAYVKARLTHSVLDPSDDRRTT